MFKNAIQLLRPAAATAPLRDPYEVRSQYRYWQNRILIASLVGYALFYLVRKNLPLAMPVMESDLGVTKRQLGIFLTAHGLLYGLSKFVNGILGDRANPRYFMALGLILSAVLNIWFGLSSTAVALGLLWMLNGWIQGMGFPPCARSLTHWFPAERRGTKFAVWNTSHSVGAALALVLCSMVIGLGWRWCFFLPGAIAAVGAIMLVVAMRDRPQSLGLPGIEDYSRWEERGAGAALPAVGAGGAVENSAEPHDSPQAFRRLLLTHVFGNPLIWILCIANFFVYTMRYALFDWGPTLLKETRGIQLQHAGLVVAAYEIAGIAGMLLSGWLTDRVFHGKAGRTCLLYMLLSGIGVWVFWRFPVQSEAGIALLLGLIGFAIYGPQCLVGVLAANLATKRAAATAIGLTGFFGYLSGVLSGWGFGRMADHGGWDPVFKTLLAAAAVAAALFACCWNATPKSEPGTPRAEASAILEVQ